MSGGICLGARTDLVVTNGGKFTVKSYISDILEERRYGIGADFISMLNNVRPHTVRSTQAYLSMCQVLL